MIKEGNLTCINCPLGCSINVKLEDGQIKEISGNSCKRGEIYAKTEMTNPVRTVTSTVRLEGSDEYLVSVKTKYPIPKGKIRKAMEDINKVSIKAPVHIGDVILENVADTGIKLVATAERN